MVESAEFNKVLVTGGAGYLGSQIIRDLAPICKEIRILDNFTGNGNPLALVNLPKKKYKVINASILDPLACKKAMDGVSIVFHLAAVTEIEYSKKHPEETLKVNVEGTNNLIKVAELNKVDKFIFPSSAAMYGFKGHFNEDSGLKPEEPYSESKKKCEELINNSNVNGLIFRQATIFGFAQNIRFNTILNQLTFEALSNKPLVLFNRGEHTRCFVHVADVSKAYIKFMKSDLKGTYNLGAYNEKVIEVAKRIKDVIPSTEIVLSDKPVPSSYTIDFSRINAKGLEITKSIKDGIEDIAARFKGLLH